MREGGEIAHFLRAKHGIVRECCRSGQCRQTCISGDDFQLLTSLLARYPMTSMDWIGFTAKSIYCIFLCQSIAGPDWGHRASTVACSPDHIFKEKEKVADNIS
ncbi:hypothetical protein AKJ16_DCAP23692 [Drosera capensis]